MGLAACITTRNRPQELEACLQALWNSTVKPQVAIVSDDSPDLTVQQKNREIVHQFPGTTYVLGPQRGVCANRNNAVNNVIGTDLVVFLDDDVCVESEFISLALIRYKQLSTQQQKCTILSGITLDNYGQNVVGPTKLSFRGYFCPAEVPESANIHAAVFPRSFFDQEQWDENIFFGYEDAELSLRAIRAGYTILFCPDLKALPSCFGEGSLVTPSIAGMTNYELYIESARLYVGIKRYKYLFPNFFKLITFVSIYLIHIILFLTKRQALQALPTILLRSQAQKLWSSYRFEHYSKPLEEGC